jgi:cytochrome c556
MINFNKYMFLTISLLFYLSSFHGSAHEGITSEVVKARMEAMKELAVSIKTLSKVARGRLPFKISEVEEIMISIKHNASMTPKLFSVYETDPLSEAATEIWENFEDFKGKAEMLEMIAFDLSSTVTVKDDLPEAMKILGSTCKSCHAKYRN